MAIYSDLFGFWTLVLSMINVFGIPSIYSQFSSRRSTLGHRFKSNSMWEDSVPNGSLQWSISCLVSVSVSLCVSVCLCVCVSVCLSACLPVCLPGCPPSLPPCLPSFLPPSLLPSFLPPEHGKIPQKKRWTFPQKIALPSKMHRTRQFLTLLTWHWQCASRHKACTFSTSQLPKVLRRWGVL